MGMFFCQKNLLYTWSLTPGGVHYCIYHKPAVRPVSSSDSQIRTPIYLPVLTMWPIVSDTQKWPSRRLFKRNVCKARDQFNLFLMWNSFLNAPLLRSNMPAMMLSDLNWFCFWWLLFNLFFFSSFFFFLQLNIHRAREGKYMNVEVGD